MRGSVLFYRSNIRVCTQLVQVISRKFPGIPIDDFELMGDLARGGGHLALNGGKVGRAGDAILECDDVSVGGGIRNL